MKNKASFIGFFSNSLMPNGCKIGKGDAFSHEIIKLYDPDSKNEAPEYFQEYAIEVPDIKAALTIINYTFRKYSLGKDLYMISVKVAFDIATKVLNGFFMNDEAHIQRQIELSIEAEKENEDLVKLERQVDEDAKVMGKK